MEKKGQYPLLPNSFAFRITSDNTIDDRGFASFGVSVFPSYSVYFDIL